MASRGSPKHETNLSVLGEPERPDQRVRELNDSHYKKVNSRIGGCVNFISIKTKRSDITSCRNVTYPPEKAKVLVFMKDMRKILRSG
jgi:hypothetical protein